MRLPHGASVSIPKKWVYLSPTLPCPQEEKAVIKADLDERQAFADRLGLSIPVAKEAERDVALAKRTAFHHTGQHHSTNGLCRIVLPARSRVCVAPPLQPPPPRVPSVDRCVHSPSCHQLQTWRGGDSPCSLCGPQLGAAPPAGRQEERGAVSGSVVLSWGFSPAPQSGGSRQPASRGASVQGSPGQRRLRLSIASQPRQPQPRLVCCVAILWWFNMHVWHLLLHHTKCHQFLS